MKKLTRENFGSNKFPAKILQFGEGNFLRAYFDFAVQKINDKFQTNYGITIIKTFPMKNPNLHNQDLLYTVTESSETQKKHTLISALSDLISTQEQYDKFIETAKNRNITIVVSNTTESGIVFDDNEELSTPKSFPARLTAWLVTRYELLKSYDALTEKVYILPCELISNNGGLLLDYIKQYAHLWNIELGFVSWLESCYFYNTLVDRIVPGYPKNFISQFEEEWGYKDEFAVLSEEFFLLAIQGNTEELDKILPLSQIGLNVVYTNDLELYRSRKVAVLNGSHTALMAISLLLGVSYVSDSLQHPQIAQFLEKYLSEEVFIALNGDEDLQSYILSVLARFKNPYLEHQWQSISLNSLSKFNVRNLPIMNALHRAGHIPHKGLFALASLWYYYSLEERNDSEYYLFLDCLQKSDGSDSRLIQLLSQSSLYADSLPKEWLPFLTKYFIEIANNPELALTNILR